jgi:hypothetical protein
MKNYFKNIIKKYENVFGEKEFAISPISKPDVEIFIEILEALKKIDGFPGDLLEILNSYKDIKDDVIFEQLVDWNLDHQEGYENNKSTSSKKECDLIPPKYFINIQDVKICSDYIYSYEKADLWDFDKQKNSYLIILNASPPDATKVATYSNRTFKFYNEEDRDNEFESLDNFFKNNDRVKFIN